jgi:hypothetical protein
LLLALTGGFMLPLHAQSMQLPVEAQVPLLLKLLSFDRNFRGRAGGELVIAILFQGGNRESVNVKSDVEAALKQSATALGGLPLRAVSIDLDEEPDLASVLAARTVVVMYVSPLRAVDIREITKASRKAQVRSFTGVPHYVEQGIALGLGLRGDLPQIIINLPAAREEGADYGAQVLKLARVIQ